MYVLALDPNERIDEGRGKQLYCWCIETLGSSSPMKRHLNNHEWRFHCAHGIQYQFLFASPSDFTEATLKYGGGTIKV